jgi:hypothetical protein
MSAGMHSERAKLFYNASYCLFILKIVIKKHCPLYCGKRCGPLSVLDLEVTESDPIRKIRPIRSDLNPIRFIIFLKSN